MGVDISLYGVGSVGGIDSIGRIGNISRVSLGLAGECMELALLAKK